MAMNTSKTWLVYVTQSKLVDLWELCCSNNQKSCAEWMCRFFSGTVRHWNSIPYQCVVSAYLQYSTTHEISQNFFLLANMFHTLKCHFITTSKGEICVESMESWLLTVNRSSQSQTAESMEIVSNSPSCLELNPHLNRLNQLQPGATYATILPAEPAGTKTYNMEIPRVKVFNKADLKETSSDIFFFLFNFYIINFVYALQWIPTTGNVTKVWG